MSFISDKISEQIEGQLAPVNQWLESLEERERHIVIGGAIALVIMLFYIIIWEPITSNFDQQQQRNQSQRQLYSWMKNSSTEIQKLKASGGGTAAKSRSQSISSLADRSAITAGIKPFIDKIDQNKKGVKVSLKEANFDKIILWLAELENKYGITSSKLKIEKSKTDGSVDAQITLERSS